MMHKMRTPLEKEKLLPSYWIDALVSSSDSRNEM
jgi:hypothetical protein